MTALFISVGVVDQYLFFTIYFDDRFKLGVCDNVYGVGQRLRELQLYSNRTFFDQVKVALFREIRRQIVCVQRISVFVFFSIDIQPLVSSILSAAGEQRDITRKRLMIFKVAIDRFYIVVRLAVDVDLDAAEVKVFKVERIAPIRSVERCVIYHRDNDSARYLPRKQPFVHVISHTRTDAVTFTDDTSDRILGVSDFERFSLFDKNGRRNMYLTYEQFTFVYLDAKLWVRSVGHQRKGILRAYEA